MRTRSSPAHLERRGRRHNSVEFNPMFPNNFICSDDNGSILLYDLRKCFYSNDSTAHAPLMKYTTSMCRSNFVSRPADITSAVWHPEGRLIGAVTHNSTPTIYEMSNPHPLCILQCAESQGQHYQSVITIKTGAFSTSLGDDYFLSGSEDKHAYGWKLPSIDEMRENQRVNNWVNSTSIGFKSDGKKIIPMKVPKATIALGGHRSIVNSIACHPELPYIITAGVEKVVRLHSPIPLQSRDHDCDKLTHGIDQGHGRAYFEDDLEEDSDVITYFDRLVASHSVPNGPTWIVCPSRANYSDTENTSDGD